MTSVGADGLRPGVGLGSDSAADRAPHHPPDETLGITSVQPDSSGAESIRADPKRLVAAARRGIELSEDRWVFGTAASLGYRLGVTPASMRAAFITLVLAGGWGVPLYGMGWLYLNRSTPPKRVPRPSAERHIGLIMVTVGLLLASRIVNIGFVGSVVWPSAVIAAVAAMAWGRGDKGDEVSFTIRLMTGAMVVFASLISMRISRLGFGEVVLSLLFSGVMLSGMAMVMAPSLLRVRGELDEVREARARSEERDRMAAHLHDSVLQTLSLIQRNADQPELSAQLARRQERELRSWLYDSPVEAGTLRVGPELIDIASEIEDHHGVTVEIVTVGDTVPEAQARASHEAIQALLAAAREAILNAAKHAETDRIDVFCEVAPAQIEVFVRDTGRGFCAEDVAADRRGITQSIEARMHRVGGTAKITSSIGEGTEVELCAPLAPCLDTAEREASSPVDDARTTAMIDGASPMIDDATANIDNASPMIDGLDVPDRGRR